jgi:phytanoyl-CoA hydroxylase
VELTNEQLEATRRDGFILIEAILSPEECGEYLARLDDYTHERRHVPKEITLQREPRVERGEVAASPGDDVRKVSGVAYGDDLFQSLVLRPGIVDVMQQLMSPNLKLFRADVLMKPAGVGSAKGVHQDAPYWPIEPMALWSCWMPFDPATKENGCMQVIPGSHKRGALPHVAVQDDYVVPAEHYDPDALVLVPMKPGTGLFFHSLLIHGTAPNTSPNPRRAITMSYMASEFHYTGNGPKPEYLRISGADVPGGV